MVGRCFLLVCLVLVGLVALLRLLVLLFASACLCLLFVFRVYDLLFVDAVFGLFCWFSVVCGFSCCLIVVRFCFVWLLFVCFDGCRWLCLFC